MNQTSFQENFKSQYLDNLTKGQNIYFERIIQKMIYQSEKEIPLNILKQTKKWFDHVHHLNFLDQFIQEDFHELIFHNNQIAQLQWNGVYYECHIDSLSIEDYQLALEVLSQRHHQNWNRLSPFVSFNFNYGNKVMRASLIHFSATPDKNSKLFLRSICEKPFPLKSFFLRESAPKLEGFLEKLILEKRNILIAGATGSGKTSFLSTLLTRIKDDEHLIILEDVHEIQQTNPYYTSLLADSKQSNKSLASYCAYALRMKPDRLIIGEMRSSEVIPFLLAMNTGHRGLTSTIHANSLKDALARIALLFSLYQEGRNMDYELVLKLVCQNIDYVIFLENRKIKGIGKVLGSEDSTPYLEEVFTLDDLK